MPNGIRQSERQRGRAGFTLIELLVVVGIIAILVGILLPVVATVRRKAQDAATRAMITQLAEAIHHYYQDFRSYPGPIPEASIYGNNATTTPTLPLKLTSTAPAGLTAVSSAENLVLGLLGGITPPTATGATSFTYAAANLQPPTGPQSLNYMSPRQLTTYYDPKPADLSNDGAGNVISWTMVPASVGGGKGGVTPTGFVIPEFMDQYSNPHPIIYLRAVVGGNSICDTARSSSTPGSQYFTAELNPYWRYYPTNSNGVPNMASPALPSASAFATPTDNNGNPTPYPTAISFFQNPTLQDGVTPRSKDSFILISAGADGLFGTNDDVTYSN